MTVLENAAVENAGTENAGTGKCRYWKMPVGYWKMPILKMPVLENAGTGKCEYCSVANAKNCHCLDCGISSGGQVTF